MDVLTTAAGVYALKQIGCKELVIKVLGPSADRFGASLGNLSGSALEGVGKVFSRAVELLGDKANSPGGVPPKLAWKIIDECVVVNDPITTEYLAGVLASSRTDLSLDDRGVSFVGQISRLSHYQILFHYLLYHTFRETLLGFHFLVNRWNNTSGARIAIPFSEIAKATGWPDDSVRALLTHCATGLAREQLIANDWKIGDLLTVNGKSPKVVSGILVGLSISGVDLFLWGHGKADLLPADFLDRGSNFDKLSGIVKMIAEIEGDYTMS